MSSIATDRFRINNAVQFIESVKSTNFYVTIGEPLPWVDDPSRRPSGSEAHSDSNPPVPLDSDFESNQSHWSDMIFAKKLFPDDAVPSIPRYDYDPNEIYSKYDPKDKDLFSKKFHVTVLDTTVSPAVHRVYKCISNGDGQSPAGNTRPSGSTSQPIPGSNGYLWKFMYTLNDQRIVSRLLTPTHIPVPSVKNINNVFPTESEFNRNSSLNREDFPVSSDGTFGHGYDPLRELGATFVNMNVRIVFDEVKTEEDENGESRTRNKVIRENEYRKIGIVANPIQSNGELANKEVYDQLTELELTVSQFTNKFEEDEKILDSNDNVVGMVIEHGAFDGTENNLSFLKVIELNGGVERDNSIRGENSGVTAGIVNKRIPELKPNTGDFVFMQQRSPIPRSQEQSESLTIVVEF